MRLCGTRAPGFYTVVEIIQVYGLIIVFQSVAMR